MGISLAIPMSVQPSMRAPEGLNTDRPTIHVSNRKPYSSPLVEWGLNLCRMYAWIFRAVSYHTRMLAKVLHNFIVNISNGSKIILN